MGKQAAANAIDLSASANPPGHDRIFGTVPGFLDRESVLGGQKIEGVVVKPLNYDLFGPDKKCLMGKFVSESFKEIHGVEWKKENPAPTDVVQAIAASVRTPARWHKSVQHLRERGLLQDSPRDIRGAS